MNWVEALQQWLESNSSLSSYIAAVTSVIAIIGIPSVASLAKSLANARENRSYRGVTLVRVLWLASFILAVIGCMAESTAEDADYNGKLSNVKRLSDLQPIAAERSAKLAERAKRIESLRSQAQGKVSEFTTVPMTKKESKRAAKAKRKGGE